MIGKGENFRPISLSMHQHIPDAKVVKTMMTPDLAASNNPLLEGSGQADPTLFCTGYRKNRFYMFTKREPDDSSIGASEDGILTGLERDVFNEKPTREDLISATNTEASGNAQSKLAESCVMHTTQGDIYLKLFPNECPRSVRLWVVIFVWLKL